LNPRIIVVENVSAFLTRKVRHPSTALPVSAASLLIEMLQQEYVVFPLITDLSDYGVPQTRERAFLTFVDKHLDGLSYLSQEALGPYPLPTHVPEYGGIDQITLSEALRSFCLPSLDAKCQDTASSQRDNNYKLHFVPIWSDRRYKMVAAIPPNTGASAWQNTQCENCGNVDVEEDDAVCPNCQDPLLRPVMKESDGTYRLIKGYRATSYRRMYPDRPAATVTTGSGHLGSSYNIHPYENRLLSPLECALLQTIPRDFNWGNALAKWGHTNIREMIGEAVPPLFTKRHGEVLIDLLQGTFPHKLLPNDDIRCLRAMKALGGSHLPTFTSSHPTADAQFECDLGLDC
jgi:DNA (cytosine-5)-methyltransferase 1